MPGETIKTIDIGKEIMRDIGDKLVSTLRELSKDPEIKDMNAPDALRFVASLIEEEVRKKIS